MNPKVKRILEGEDVRKVLGEKDFSPDDEKKIKDVAKTTAEEIFGKGNADDGIIDDMIKNAKSIAGVDSTPDDISSIVQNMLRSKK